MKLQSEIEDIVCNLLSVVADEPQEQIDRDMPFDRFGLDSLARVGLITELSRKLGKSFDTEDAADCETPRELAKFIVQLQPEAKPPTSISKAGSDTILWNRCRERDRYFTDLKSVNRFVFEPVFSSNQGMRVESEGRSLLMMNSYNYLGYNDHPQVRAAAKAAIDEFGPGIHGSRVLAGTTTRHRQLEMSLAAVMNAEDAVIYNTGYVANLSTIQALLGKGDHVVCDQFCHASLIDGSRFSGASLTMFRHNDPESLLETLHGITADVKLVVVDGVYSMEGDLAPLPEIVDVCRSEGAYLMVDEAHSFPIIGHTGRGVQEHFNLPADAIDIKMGTLSKG
ncbi:MAG TPA: aminotransferase class I/II-fold pyridoxal phosphate-dependent enzyme, partial [Planctomycetaceae bacterium]|nr:aminotransferase class I/II-fold pyridoxal phosphate-dependent enzyme [Planctomycetaceae bacterium]